MSRGTLIHTTEFGIIEPTLDDYDSDNILISGEEEEPDSYPTAPSYSPPREEKEKQQIIGVIDTDYNEVYVYDPNHSRGATTMNTYDRTNLKLEYDYVHHDAMPKWEIIFRNSLYIIQILMVITSGIISCGAIVAERDGWQFADGTGIIYGTMEEELIYVPYICGVMSVITSFIGCIGAKSRNKCGRFMLILYIVALGISLMLGIASVAQGFADQTNVYKYAQRQWDQLTDEQEDQFEWEHFCCNFKDLDPCCRFTYGEGECVNEYVCYEKVKQHLLNNFEIIVITAALHTVYLFVVMFLTVSLYAILHFKYKRDEKQKEDGNVEQVDDDEEEEDHFEGGITNTVGTT